MIIGQKRLHFTQVDSTNSEAKRIIDAKEDIEGTIITADVQTQGRGQQSKTWHSDVGQNIMLSTILHPDFLAIKDQFALNAFVSIAVAKVVERYTESVHVKWPNDVYVGDAKICGILIQNFIQGKKISKSIIGIGLNVHQKSWPESVPNATSLSLLSEDDVNIAKIQNELLVELNRYYYLLRNHLSALNQQYQNYLYRRNKLAKYQLGESEIIATILGTNNLGELKVMMEDQSIRTFQHGEINFII